MIKVILIRHGSREHRGYEDAKAPLSPSGIQEVEQLAAALGQLETAPTICLTSTKLHAEQTGTILTTALGCVPQLSLDGLCRTTAAFDLFRQAEGKGMPLSSSDAVLIVGHEPALGQLGMNLTSGRQRPLHHAEAVCLLPDNPIEFLKGKARIDFRYPAVDYQEASLREKIRSKAHIATFLAGFTFTGLIELLLSSDPRSGLRIAAIVCLTLALALFVASIYVYDALGMPDGFWLYGGRSRLEDVLLHKLRMQFLFEPLVRRARDERKHERPAQTFRRHGPLYVYMVSTWTIVFTPAVLLALAGFMALVLDTNDATIYVGAAVSLIAAGVLYWRVRPRLGVD
jgi:phosphohistidine phosphatase SixA